jgi:hypothetical protein
VTLGEAAAVGNVLYYTNATGALHSMAPTATLPGASTLIPNGQVVRFPTTGAGPAVIKL